MDSKAYWRNREERNRQKNSKAEKSYDKIIGGYYDDALERIQKEIDAFYGRYASKEGISIAEAKKRASKLDIEAYGRKAKKYVKEKNFSKRANAEMRIYNLTMKVNRLELLKENIRLELLNLHSQVEQELDHILHKRARGEFERQAGILGDSAKNITGLVETIASASFYNASYSDRIWTHQELLKAELSKLLQKGILQGKNPRVLAAELRKAVNASKYDAERLMRTELARVQTAAQMESYKRNGFEEYVYIALSTACKDCKPLDGKVFKVKDMQPGENASPMHPHCMCSTAAHMDREEYERWLDSFD